MFVIKQKWNQHYVSCNIICQRSRPSFSKIMLLSSRSDEYFEECVDARNNLLALEFYGKVIYWLSGCQLTWYIIPLVVGNEWKK